LGMSQPKDIGPSQTSRGNFALVGQCIDGLLFFIG